MKSIMTVTTKGQVTIPIELRRELGIEPGDRIQFEAGEGGLQLRRIPSIESVFGSVKPVARANARKPAATTVAPSNPSHTGACSTWLPTRTQPPANEQMA